MAESAPKVMTAGPETASVRAGVLAAATVSLVMVSIATFELSMADWPSGFVLMVILPLAVLCVVLTVSRGGAITGIVGVMVFLALALI